MQKINHLLQRFLGLILSGNILERHTGTLLHIDLGIGLANTHGTAAHTLHQKGEQYPEQYQRNHKTEDIVDDDRSGVGNLAVNLHVVRL